MIVFKKKQKKTISFGVSYARDEYLVGSVLVPIPLMQ